MGSGGSKTTVIQVAPKDQAENVIENDNKAKKEGTKQQGKTAFKDSLDDNNVECSPEKNINTPQGPNLPEVKKTNDENVAVTSENVDEILKSKGFDDVVLASHCRNTPDLLDTFIKIFEHVQFAELGFADVCKDVVDKLLSKYPNMLSVVKFEPVSEKNADNANESDGVKNTDNANRSDGAKNADTNTNGSGGEKYLDNTTVFDAENSKDSTNVSDPEKSKDSTNASGGEKNSGNTDPDIDKAKKELKKARVFLQTLLRISVNYTDLCDAMSVAFSKAGLVPIWVNFVEQLKDCTEFHLKWVDDNGNLKKKTDRGLILSMTLGTIHNMAKRIPTRANFHACNAVRILVPYLEDPIAFFATKALLSLAYLIDESNEELIKSKEEPITFMISILRKAIAKENKRHIGLSSSEIANGLAQISINDNNKKLIVTHGAIPVLMSMITSANDDEERIEAVGALWSLAFDEDNRIKMRETEGLLELLRSMKSNNNNQITKVVNGALWEIEGKQSHASEESTASKGPMQNHIMISYQWDVQKLMIQVKNRLQSSGFRVWMDLEQMGGSTLAAMAEAVENSAVVLICISQKYKESANCRSEAEYAFQLKKDIVPIMLEKNYRPTGWLGMILGSKLWIDFTQGLRRLETSAKELIRELGTRGKEGEQTVTAMISDTVDASGSKSKPKVDISGWTNSDVMTWIETFDIETKEKNSLHKLNGTMLMLLHSLRSESPDYYYTSLKDDIGLYDVCSVLRFTHELEKLCG